MDVKYLTVEKLTLKEIARIFVRIKRTTNNCWQWTGGYTSHGYGIVHWRTHELPIHRLMYAWAVEAIPAGKEVSVLDHLCRNRLCCNPCHLELVSPGLNTLRGISPPAINARRTHCLHGHALTEENIRRYRNMRKCKKCDLLRHHYRQQNNSTYRAQRANREANRRLKNKRRIENPS